MSEEEKSKTKNIINEIKSNKNNSIHIRTDFYKENVSNFQINTNGENQEEENLLHNDKFFIYDRIEEIIDNGDFNLKTYKIIFFSTFFIFFEGFYLSYFSSILTPFQTYYEISDLLVSFIGAFQFFSKSLGCMTVGLLARKVTRRRIIIFSLIMMIILHICLYLFKILLIFCLCRFISSYFLGLSNVLILNILTEYLPIKLRGFILNSIWIFWGFGSIYFLLMCKIFIPSLEYIPGNPDSTQDFYSAIFQLIYFLIICLIFLIFYLEDSPRNLLIKGNFEEAKNILDYYTNNKISHQDILKMQNNINNTGENKFYDSELGIKDLFNKRNLFLTILMILIFFVLAFCYYGLIVAMPIILKEIESRNSNRINKHKIALDELIIFNIIGTSGAILGGVISEIKILGRKHSELILFSISLISSIFGLIFYNKFFNLLYSFSSSIFGIGLNLHFTYTEEIYPTKMRDNSIGFYLGIMRLAGFISQFSAVFIVKNNHKIPVYIYIGCVALLLILIIFLPKDNVREIDAVIEINKKEED